MKQNHPSIHPVDKRLQERIAAKLQAEASPCPDALWENLHTQLQSNSDQTKPSLTNRLFKILPYAAGLLLLLGLILWQRDTAPTQAVEIAVNFPQDVTAFKEAVTTQGSREEIQQHLDDAGYHINIGDIDGYNSQHGHYVQLVGADPVIVDDKPCPCLRLNFTCCGQPVVSYLVNTELQSGEITFKPNLASVQQTEQTAHGYRIVTLSAHPTEPVESLISK